jgi:hypothetical protein
MATTKTAKVQSLRVRPKRSADLSFNVPGILAIRGDKAYLKEEIQSVLDYQREIYEKLNQVDANGKLLMSASTLRDLLGSHTLFQLYNETAAASLDQMVLQRQNAFLERYKYNPERLAEIKKLFPTKDADLTGKDTEGSKLWRLSQQRSADNKKYTDLDTEYKRDQTDGIERDEVVKQQKTDTNNTVLYTDDHKITSTTTSKSITIATPEHKTVLNAAKKVDTDGTTTITEGDAFQYITAKEVKSEQQDAAGKKLPDKYESQSSSTTYPPDKGTKLNQSNVLHYSEFLHPSQENILRHERTQSDLMQEELSDALYAFRVNNLLQIWQNELNALDLEVQKFQISFVRTFLIPPFPGIITSVYKDIGESIQAGEPIIRIEDNRTLLLVGLINYRGLLSLGAKMTIKANDLFEDGKELEIKDVEVVSIRGHDSDNDIWDVILQCNNPLDTTTGTPTLPINYHFDRDNVEITVN